MILKHQHFDLLQKTVVEHMVFKPPMKADGTMHNEACFLYAVNGRSVVYSAAHHERFNATEGLVMKCGSYLNKWMANENDEPSEAVAIHFYPEVLRLVYEDKLPDFLTAKTTHKINPIPIRT